MLLACRMLGGIGEASFVALAAPFIGAVPEVFSPGLGSGLILAAWESVFCGTAASFTGGCPVLVCGVWLTFVAVGFWVDACSV